ncbi:exocyst complex component EXO70A1-like [Typha latifolia]|uniref:exocyst complex component EXO70A1-like n=1 Tax=Typha latifolia TaxID=4733 RepID=UPI003C2F6F8E
MNREGEGEEGEQGEMDRALSGLLAARRSLQSGLDKSRALGTALDRVGPRLEEAQLRLPSLAAAVRPLRADPETLSQAARHVDRAVSPAAAVLKVFDAVHGLEMPLLSGAAVSADLPGYLALLARLEEAVRFLADNCGLALQWLGDIVEYLEDNSLADPLFLSSLQSSISDVKNSQLPLDGGLLAASLDTLESEFRRLLAEHSDSAFPVAILHKLLAIMERMAANGRFDCCVTAFVDSRSSNVRAALQGLGLGYLDSPSDDAQSLMPHVAKWGNHLEFAIKYLFEAEYKLCREVFDRSPGNLGTSCFADIATQAGMLRFLRFGGAVAETKKDPIKLLCLLDVFNSLNKLRLDFNRLFGSKACAEIQGQTRDLIKRVIEGACEIFWELLVQVELQRQSLPPADGNVPRLVSFIIDYCNRLLGENYSTVLTQVLVIHRSWKQERLHNQSLDDAVIDIVKALEANLEAWSKAYEDVSLSHLFLMNTHWHFFKHLKGTKLGELLGGDIWLREHEQYKEFYAVMFLRESWGKLPALLSREGLILFSGGRATARDLVKKRLRAFNESFDEMYMKQLNWVISDKELREKTCHLIVQAVVPVYRSYMQSYGPLVEQDASASKYAKYTAQNLESKLLSLFQNKAGKSGTFRVRQSNGKVDNAVSSPY